MPRSLMMTSAPVIAFAAESDGFVQQTADYVDNSERINELRQKVEELKAAVRCLEEELHSEENDDYHWSIFLLEQELNNTPEDDKQAREAIEAQIAALNFLEFVKRQYDTENKINEYWMQIVELENEIEALEGQGN